MNPSPGRLDRPTYEHPDGGPMASAWHPAAWSDELRPDGTHAVELLGRRLVLFRDRNGHTAALRDHCPHRGTALSLGRVVAGSLACPYHGWEFDGTGRCTRIPSLGPEAAAPDVAGAQAVGCVERDGLVWVSLASDRDPRSVPRFPTASTNPGLRLIAGEPLEWQTSAGRHLENILDLAHFPFVHPGTFGCAEAEHVEPHDVTMGDAWIECSVGVSTRNPDTVAGPLYAGMGPTIRLGYRYRVEVPYRVTLEFSFPDGMRRALHEVVAPTAADRCVVYWALLVDRRLESSDADEVAFARAVFAEDQPIIESQPPGVPVDRRAELHLPSDRLAVAYRRALREWGLPDDALV